MCCTLAARILPGRTPTPAPHAQCVGCACTILLLCGVTTPNIFSWSEAQPPLFCGGISRRVCCGFQRTTLIGPFSPVFDRAIRQPPQNGCAGDEMGGFLPQAAMQKYKGLKDPKSLSSRQAERFQTGSAQCQALRCAG